MISRSASRMILRMPASVRPRQSVSPAISWSIRSDGFIGFPCLRILVPFSCESAYCRSVLRGQSVRKKSSNDVALPHPQSRKNKPRNEDKPSGGGVVWNLVKRAINVTEYRNAKDEVNPAKNRTCSNFGGGLGDDEGRLLQGRFHGVVPP